LKHSTLKEIIKKTLAEMSMTGGGTAGAAFSAGVGMNYATPKAFKKKKVNESTHPWYTSIYGYYAGETKAGGGPRHTGNVIDYLKPGTMVYNANGDSKNIKDLTDQYLIFTDGTKDYFMNWFPKKPDLYETKTPYGTGNLGPGPKATKHGVKDNYYVKAFGFKLVDRKKQAKASKAVDYKDLWGSTYK
jgi:hypothetical protein